MLQALAAIRIVKKCIKNCQRYNNILNIVRDLRLHSNVCKKVTVQVMVQTTIMAGLRYQIDSQAISIVFVPKKRLSCLIVEHSH
jgi:hypothetical protein